MNQTEWADRTAKIKIKNPNHVDKKIPYDIQLHEASGQNRFEYHHMLEKRDCLTPRLKFHPLVRLGIILCTNFNVNFMKESILDTRYSQVKK